MTRYIHYDPILSSILKNDGNKKELDVTQAETENKNATEDSHEETRNDNTVSHQEVATTTADNATTNTKGTTKSSQWNIIKSIVKNSSHDSKDEKCISSMTDQERAFINMRKKYSAMNNKSQSSLTSVETTDSTNSFASVVDGAIARAKLRQALSIRLSKLTAKEADFLRDLVNDDNVTKQQLENADHVLNTDPLYRLPGETSNMESIESVEEVEVPQNSKLSDVIQGHRVQIDGRNIEILMNWDDYGGELTTGDSLRMSTVNTKVDIESEETIPFFPSTFSYKTWAVKDKKKPILGLPEDFQEASQVLSPPMMASLRKSLPYTVSEDYFWLKYAMGTHGAGLQNLHHCIRQSSKTLLAIETVNGEVFGAFVSSPWRHYPSYYGSCESFLWRVNQSRFTPTSSVEEQTELESNVDVYKWSQENRNIQMSDKSKLVIGGGFPDDDDDGSDEWGLGIALGADLYEGTSSNCVTFKSPGLSQVSPKGEVFEVKNLEVWVSFFDCMTYIFDIYLYFFVLLIISYLLNISTINNSAVLFIRRSLHV